MTEARQQGRRTRTTTPARGTLLDDRYLLEEQLANPTAPASMTWLATDDVLARPVVVRLAPIRSGGRELLKVATRVGSVSHPGLAPVLDTVSGTVSGVATGWQGVVREWVVARPLHDLLTEASPSAGRTVTLMRALAEALDRLQRNDFHHGHLVPSNVFVKADGRVAITDAGIAAALRAPGQDADLAERDLDDLASILHACLSGTWPGVVGECPGLPPTPRDGNRACSPKQVRAGVPRDLDAIWSRLADRRRVTAIRSVRELISALDLQPSSPLGVEVADYLGPENSGQWGLWRRRFRRGAPWIALTLLGSLGWVLGIAVGTLPGQGGHSGPVTITAPGSSPAPEIKPVTVRDFDPPPGDGHENTAAVPLAHDGDVSTAWLTDIYQGSPRLGGLKSGVGLLVDLGALVRVQSVTLSLPTDGESVEIRAADQTFPSASQFTTVASVSAAKTLVNLRITDAMPHRYWLIWITSLPKVAGGYQGGISEFAFIR